MQFCYLICTPTYFYGKSSSQLATKLSKSVRRTTPTGACLTPPGISLQMDTHWTEEVAVLVACHARSRSLYIPSGSTIALTATKYDPKSGRIVKIPPRSINYRHHRFTGQDTIIIAQWDVLKDKATTSTVGSGHIPKELPSSSSLWANLCISANQCWTINKLKDRNSSIHPRPLMVTIPALLSDFSLVESKKNKSLNRGVTERCGTSRVINKNNDRFDPEETEGGG